MTAASTIAGLILAAGESSRMGPLGKDKALLIYRGRTFLETIVATMRQAGVAPVAVVLGHHVEEIQRAVDLKDATVVVNHAYHLGQTSSLQAGLRVLIDQAADELAAVVLCPVDHPAVSADTVRELVANFRASGATVVIPTYHGQRGHPAVIGRPLFGELLSLNPDEGANTVFRKYRDDARFVEANDPGVLVDVDEPADYRRLNQA